MSALSPNRSRRISEEPTAQTPVPSEKGSSVVADCSTVGVPMVGDPVFDDSGVQGLTVRRACQYAAEMARKAGCLTGVLSRFDARLEGRGTVVFIAADASQREVARFVIPERVLRFDPFKPALRLADERSSVAAADTKEGTR